ncbi:MAG: hypothetical protein ACKVP2_06205 [Burkholderiales bacterium]
MKAGIAKNPDSAMPPLDVFDRTGIITTFAEKSLVILGKQLNKAAA